MYTLKSNICSEPSFSVVIFHRCCLQYFACYQKIIGILGPSYHQFCLDVVYVQALAFSRVLRVHCMQEYINHVRVGLGNCSLLLPFLVLIQHGVQKRIPPLPERLDSLLDPADVEWTQPWHEISRHEQALQFLFTQRMRGSVPLCCKQFQRSNFSELTPHGYVLCEGDAW